MNVSKFIFEMLESQLTGLPERNWSWEIQILQPIKAWTTKDVRRFVDHFSQYEDFDYFSSEDTLEVTANAVVLSIEGAGQISNYCLREDFTGIEHEWFEQAVLSSVKNDALYNVHFISDIVQSKPTTVDESSLNWKQASKQYKITKRIGYTYDGVHYVMDQIRESKLANEMSLAEFESRVEMKVVFEKEMPVEDIIQHLMFLYSEWFADRHPLTLDEQKHIIDKYHRLILPARENNIIPYFLAPKPVTLEQKNLIEPDQLVGVTSVLNNYAVTDKADGERMLMFVDEKGEAFLINSAMQVMKMGISAASHGLHNSLFDGEYINGRVYAIFDVYFIKGENLMKLPLISDEGPARYEKIKSSIQKDLWNTETSHITLEAKIHTVVTPSNFFKVCKNTLETTKYTIDGLIFTPTDLPVFAYYPNQFKKIKGKSVAWDKVFKWKPPEQNTIDFLVKEEAGVFFDRKTQQKFKRFKLFTGYNAAQWEDISVWNGLQRAYRKDAPASTADENYKAKIFKPIEYYKPSVSIATIPVDSSGHALTLEKEPIEDNTIVEMFYQDDKWIPMRIREDKTKLLRTTNSISKTANDLSVALSIWHNIHHPVTLEHIIGEKKVPVSAVPADIESRMLGTNDVYYARDIPRNHMLSVHMLNFHNHGIKAMLYAEPPVKNNLLELACGMAGDLPRWREHRYSFILGVDLVKNNIEGASGSYARYLNQRQEFFKRNQRGAQRIFYPQAVFVIGDCALPLENGDAAKGKDYDSEQVLRLLYQGKTNEKYSFLNAHRLVGKANQKFDVVSCQFAIHYFFKTKELLEGFLRNVAYNLKPDGRFIATFMDGQRVHSLISKTGSAKGVKEDTTVWAIQKQYTSFTKQSPYGKLIDVYLENTNHFIPEFLVNFDVLKEKAKEYQLELVNEGFFETTFRDLLSKVQNNEPRNTHLDQDIMSLSNDAVQTEFSFLNRWVIFRRVALG